MWWAFHDSLVCVYIYGGISYPALCVKSRGKKTLVINLNTSFWICLMLTVHYSCSVMYKHFNTRNSCTECALMATVLVT